MKIKPYVSLMANGHQCNAWIRQVCQLSILAHWRVSILSAFQRLNVFQKVVRQLKKTKIKNKNKQKTVLTLSNPHQSSTFALVGPHPYLQADHSVVMQYVRHASAKTSYKLQWSHAVMALHRWQPQNKDWRRTTGASELDQLVIEEISTVLFFCFRTFAMNFWTTPNIITSFVLTHFSP